MLHSLYAVFLFHIHLGQIDYIRKRVHTGGIRSGPAIGESRHLPCEHMQRDRAFRQEMPQHHQEDAPYLSRCGHCRDRLLRPAETRQDRKDRRSEIRLRSHGKRLCSQDSHGICPQRAAHGIPAGISGSDRCNSMP